MAQEEQDASCANKKTRDAKGLRKVAEKMECCGSLSGYHKPECVKYNEIRQRRRFPFVGICVRRRA